MNVVYTLILSHPVKYCLQRLSVLCVDVVIAEIVG